MNDDDQAKRSRRRSDPGRSRASSASSAKSARRRSLRIYFATLAAVVAVIAVGLFYAWPAETVPVSAPSAGAAESAPKPRERTAALAPLHLPADDAPHGSGMEWWYYNGILSAKDGGRYAFHVAVFVANGLIKHTVMHAALTDLQTGKRFASQTRTGGIPAQRVANGFDFKQDGWQVSASGPSHLIRTAFQGTSMALELTDSQPAVAHRAAGSDTPGLLDFGNSGISYYYSRPRIAAQGQISIAGKPVQVSGEVWFDHQWGDFDVLTLGWNWFALHLADGSDVMLYQLFDPDGQKVLTAGTVSDAKGNAQPLKSDDIEMTPIGTWTSPKTKINYPVDWRVKLPSGVLNIKPFLPDGEFDSGETSANVYWEGPVKVSGSSDGEGFLELSGYERLATAPPARK